MQNVQRKVGRLPDYKWDIIRTVYTGEEQVPDEEAYAKLYHAGWYVSDRYYDDEKAKAIQTLAEAFRIVQYE